MKSPIVVLIASYKEGTLIQGAIRSVLKCSPRTVIVFDGPTEGVEVEGDDTDLGPYRRFLAKRGEWPSEHDKRSEMLAFARRKMGVTPFWILTLDADEILVWGEFLPDWLGQLRPGFPHSDENVVPLKRTEMEWREAGGFWTQISPSRLAHSSLVFRYMVSCWMIQTPDGSFGFLDHRDAERMPLYGEPHVHHRSYLRRPERKVLRLYEGEEKRFLADPAGFMLEWHGIKGYELKK